MATTMEGFSIAQEKHAINAEALQLRQTVDAASKRFEELGALIASTPDMLEKAKGFREIASICELADRVKRRRDELAASIECRS